MNKKDKENNEKTREFKQRKLRIVYEYGSISDEPIIGKQNTDLITLNGEEVLMINEFLGNNPIPYDTWEIMKAWGRLKLKIPVGSDLFIEKDDIDLIQNALNGCERSKSKLRYISALYVLEQPFHNSCGTIYCIDIQSNKSDGLCNEDDEDLKELKALVS